MTLPRALIAIVLLLNGMTIPPATAMHAAAGAMSHVGHDASDPDSPDASMGAAHDHVSGSMSGDDCCEDMSCDCGCAVPQAMTLTAPVPRACWRTELPEFAFVVKSFHSSPLSAPFRPPA